MNKMILLAGPCSMESEDVCFEAAEALLDLCKYYPLDFYFKTSFDKANRTALSSYRGLGLEKGLEILADVRAKFGCRIVTDIHEPWQAKLAAQVADIIQIPAFLCRQTDLLSAAAKTGKIVNVKKAQFLAPWDMANVVKKIEDSGSSRIMLCERGTVFGYNNLVVDMTSIPQMKSLGYPVIFDATHSVQKPGGNGSCSGGNSEYAPCLARCALAAGADGLFVETHPDPSSALCDGPNMVPLSEMKDLVKNSLAVFDLTKEM